MVLFNDLKNIIFFFALCTADTQFIAYPKSQGSAVVNRWACEARCNGGCTFTKGNEIEATVLFYCRGQDAQATQSFFTGFLAAVRSEQALYKV